jgi:hypothetical protein
VGNAACIEGIKAVFIEIKKPESTRPHGRPRRRREDDIKTDPQMD